MTKKTKILLAFLGCLLANMACAASSDTETKTITSGDISSGTITGGKFVPKATPDSPIQLPAEKYDGNNVTKNTKFTVTKGKIKSGLISEGNYSGDVTKGITAQNAKLSNIEIDNAIINFYVDKSNGASSVASAVTLTGTLSSSVIEGATITGPVISQSSPTVPVSSNDNYLGDCFKVFIPTKDTSGNQFGGGRDTSGNLIGGGWYLTLSQDKDTDKVHLLKVNSPNGILCSANDPLPIDEPEQVTASANELVANGALRSGWVYGALVLPYKYHPDDKSFSSETSIGPYVGRRSTLGALSYIWAVTAGLTPLSVESVDQDGNKKTTNLTAFTYAAGLMFEVNKGASPFRAGIFFGRDVVSSDTAVTYKHDRKNWLAFQLGWDFVAK